MSYNIILSLHGKDLSPDKDLSIQMLCDCSLAFMEKSTQDKVKIIFVSGYR